MCTNVRQRKIYETGELIGLKDRPWYNKKAMANVISFASMSKQYRITYDNTKEEIFLVHTENGIVRFEKNQEGLYIYRLPDKYKEAVKDHNKKRKGWSN